MDVTCYRPVSLLPVVSKILEKINFFNLEITNNKLCDTTAWLYAGQIDVQLVLE